MTVALATKSATASLWRAGGADSSRGARLDNTAPWDPGGVPGNGELAPAAIPETQGLVAYHVRRWEDKEKRFVLDSLPTDE